MALTAGYIEYVETAERNSSVVPSRSRTCEHGRQVRRVRSHRRHPGISSWPGWSSGFHVVVAADENRDGRLTPEEAARLVRKADTDGDGSVNFVDIDRLIVTVRFQPRPRRADDRGERSPDR